MSHSQNSPRWHFYLWVAAGSVLLYLAIVGLTSHLEAWDAPAYVWLLAAACWVGGLVERRRPWLTAVVFLAFQGVAMLAYYAVKNPIQLHWAPMFGLTFLMYLPVALAAAYVGSFVRLGTEKLLAKGRGSAERR